MLFMTEMWERFSYYGMRALLVYYMIKQLMFSQGEASHIYGMYTGLVYLTPVFGGILADRVWGQRKTVILGAVLMAIGHFLMAFEALFFPALLFLILGNGAFKPNISTQVGYLYPKGDVRRDRAFSIFYVGINVGAFFSPLVCGTLGEVYGWHFGFSAAGVGMVLGLVIYLWGQPWLGPDNLETRSASCQARQQPFSGDEKSRVLGLVALCLVSVAFWAAFEQQGNTIALWADANTDRQILGWSFPRVMDPIPQSCLRVPVHPPDHHSLGTPIKDPHRTVRRHQDGTGLFPAGVWFSRHDSRCTAPRS